MLGSYREWIPRFVAGLISVDEFERDIWLGSKVIRAGCIREQFDIPDDLFADVDDYIGDPTPREGTRGISCEELRARERDAPTRLFDARQ